MEIKALNACILIVFLIWLVRYTKSVAITCPRISCTVELDANVWFLHDNLQPTVLMKGQSCSSNRIWEFSPSNEEFLWYSESSQYTAGTKIPSREIQANCIPIEATKQVLYGGRDCKIDATCSSGTCDEGIWAGFGKNDYCAVDADCGPKLFCKKDSQWPYRAKCTAVSYTHLTLPTKRIV